MDNFFKKVPDLIDDNRRYLNNEKNYFYKAGDIEENLNNEALENSSNILLIEDINKYVNSIVSGKEYDMECELGTLCGGGSCIVSFEELKKMIDEGIYNIIEAKCINKEMIAIKYQKFNKEYSRKFM